VLEYLGPKHLLLVLDNCEHLLDAAAGAVTLIGRSCAGVVVLATSREGLAVAGEQMVAVPSLGLPATDVSFEVLSGAEAVRLFVDRAHDAKRDFELTERNAVFVAQLCRRLDGIPLAIELAAARVRSLTPEDLVARLDHRFKLLTRGSRAALERHQTLRNTIDWSYDLLDETEREGLNRISVFAGGADLAAAEAVVSGGTIDELDVADVLSQLVDKSLVVVEEDDEGVRYRLLESIRQYAQERLEAAGEAAEVRRRHAEHFVAVAEAAGPRLRVGVQVTSAHAVARDTDNFRAALDWAAETPSPDHALRLVAPLAVNSMTIGYAAMDWAAIAVEIPGAAQHPLFPVVASWAAWGATMAGDLERATTLVRRLDTAEATLGSRQAAACQGRAVVEFFRGDLDGARLHAEEWVERAREAGDRYELAHALILFGSTMQSDPARSLATIEEAVRIARDAGILSALSIGLTALSGQTFGSDRAIADIPPDELADGLALLDEAVEVGTAIGDRQAVSITMTNKAFIAAQLGEWRPALRASADAAVQHLQLGALNGLFGPLWAAAIAFVGVGHLDVAAVLIGAADARGPRWWRGDWSGGIMGSTEAAVLEGLGEAPLAALRERGGALDPAEAVAYLRVEVDRVLSDESVP
jgi:predicted ATPase